MEAHLHVLLTITRVVVFCASSLSSSSTLQQSKRITNLLTTPHFYVRLTIIRVAVRTLSLATIKEDHRLYSRRLHHYAFLHRIRLPLLFILLCNNQSESPTVLTTSQLLRVLASHIQDNRCKYPLRFDVLLPCEEDASCGWLPRVASSSPLSCRQDTKCLVYHFARVFCTPFFDKIPFFNLCQPTLVTCPALQFCRSLSFHKSLRISWNFPTLTSLSCSACFDCVYILLPDSTTFIQSCRPHSYVSTKILKPLSVAPVNL